jgi:hypothetical protein
VATDRHSELETKFAADHVSQTRFKEWCFNLGAFRYHSSPLRQDIYYRHGDNVVRHRLASGAGELTVKQRKSTTSIIDRVEVDLTFGSSVTTADVEAFLVASGWVPDLTLDTVFSHAFWFRHGGGTIVISLYEVQRTDCTEPRRFIEVEIEKGSDISDTIAHNLLNLWAGSIGSDLNLGDPEVESLYELYSGRRYITASPQ